MLLPHIKVYNEYFGIDVQDVRPSELSGRRGVDVHHIWGRTLNEHMKLRGIVDPNDIRNLMCLTRREHDELGQNVEYNELLYELHLYYIENEVPFMQRDDIKGELIKFLYKMISIQKEKWNKFSKFVYVRDIRK